MGWPGDQTCWKGTGGNRRSPVVCNIGPHLSPWGSSGEPGLRHIGPKTPVLYTPAFCFLPLLVSGFGLTQKEYNLEKCVSAQ